MPSRGSRRRRWRAACVAMAVPIRLPVQARAARDRERLSPSCAGADHDTSARASEARAVTMPGLEGGPAGMTTADGTLVRLVPARLLADTVNVYWVPFVRPVTVALPTAGSTCTNARMGRTFNV